ncbi:MAG: DUF2202 domain-containing protein [Anaerolineaceae bacterium]
MSKKIVKGMSSLLVVATLILSLLAFTQIGTVSAANVEQKGGIGGRGGFGQGTGTTVSLTPLSNSEIDALNQAILEEYGALNLYNAVINQFGNVYPFSRIVRAEQQHVNALIKQATKYGVTAPTNPGLTNMTSFTSLQDACQAGVAAEIADAALYDDLKLVVTHSDILQVFNTLQSVSLNNHLPAFQVCQ